MRIANYLRPDCVALRQRADSLTGAVQQMVTLLDGTDNLTDTAVFAADVRARLALGGVCVGNGLAIPHAKSTAVRQLQLAALTLDPPLPCDTPDGKPLDLLVMIAAPAEANDLHVQVLAELATLFLDTDFCARLRESETPEAFCRAISAREEQDAQEPPSAPSDAAPGRRQARLSAAGRDSLPHRHRAHLSGGGGAPAGRAGPRPDAQGRDERRCRCQRRADR